MYSGRYPDVGNLPKRVEIAPGFDSSDDPDDWPWLDISADLHEGDPIELSRGCADEDSQTSSELRLTLDNLSGRYTADNPESDLWPQLDTPEPIPLRFSINTGDGAGWREWLVGMVTSLDNEWVGGVHRVLTHVEVVGILTTLGQSEAITPAFERAILGEPTLAYLYTMVGGAYDQAGVAAQAGAPSTFPLESTGRLEFDSVDGPAGATPKLPEYATSDNGAVAYTLPANTGTDEWSIEFATRMMIDSDGAATFTAYIDLMKLTLIFELSRYKDPGSGATETFIRWGSGPRGLSSGYVVPYNLGESPNVADGLWHLVRITSRNTGGDVYFDFSIDETIELTVPWDPEDPENTLVALMPKSSGREVGGGQSVSAGYFAIYDEPDVSTLLNAMRGFPGELAHERMERVCSENGIAFSCDGSTSEAVGAQPHGNLVAVLRDCEAADRGILDDSSGGITYLTREELYGVDVGMVIDGARCEIPLSFRPVRNESKRITRMTVSDNDGSSATYVAPSASGRFFDGSAQINVSEPSRLLPLAQYHVAVGTSSGYRYPQLPIAFLTAPNLIDSWTSMQLGSRIEVRNPPSQHAKGSLFQQVRGVREVFRGRRWDAEINTVSTRPYEVMVRGNQGDRRDAYASVLAAPLAAAALGDAETIYVTTWDGAFWTMDNGHLPVDANLDGERVTVTAIEVPIYDAFTRTVASGWGSPPAGDAWAANGIASASLSVNGTTGIMLVAAGGTDHCLTTTLAELTTPDHDVEASTCWAALPASNTVRSGLIMRFASTADFIRTEIRLTSAGAMTLAIVATAAGVPATIAEETIPGTYVGSDTIFMRASAYGSRLRAKAWFQADTQPAVWLVDATDASVPNGTSVGLYAGNDQPATTTPTEYDNFVVNSPQVLSVKRACDRVVRAHAVGSNMALWRPLVRGL